MNKTGYFTFHEKCSLCMHLLCGIARVLISTAEKINEKDMEDLPAEEKEAMENGFAKISDMVEYSGISHRSFNRYLKEFEDLFNVSNGLVTRKTMA